MTRWMLLLLTLALPAIAQLDVGVSAIVAPAGSVDSGTIVSPLAVCRNFGLADTVFPVTMLIGSAYSRTLLDTLAAGASNPLNDTARGTVTVLRRAVHDIGASVILAPPTTLHDGDTITPKAIIRNYGNAVERYFDVRFRIGVIYDRVVTVNSDLVPNGTVDVTFPDWVAEQGYYPVMCSTMLARDTDRLNDKTAIDIAVLPPVVLHVEWDQTERLQVAERKTVSFYAEIEGQEAGVVELRPPAAPAGWSATLYDSAGAEPLPDTDGDSLPDLGPLQPYHRTYFTVRVEAPTDIVGVPGLLAGDTVRIRGFTRRDSTICDSALLILRLTPDLAVHNFPNPFGNRTKFTTFVFGLPELGRLTLTIYDRCGERICRLIDGVEYDAGIWTKVWDATNEHGRAVAPGTYDYLFVYESGSRTRRAVKKLVVTRE